MRAGFQVVSITLALAIGMTTAAMAQSITSVSGTYLTGPSGDFSSDTVPFTGGVVGSSNGAVPLPALTPVSDVTIGPATNFGSPIGLAPGSLFIAGATFSMPGSASFASLTEVNTGPGPAGLFQLVNNFGAFDFGPLGSLWQYQLTLNGIEFAAGSPGIFTVFQQGTSSASFTLNHRFGPEEGPGVPEPSSMLIWGSVAVAGWFARRRFLTA
jgi:hypothetical protein